MRITGAWDYELALHVDLIACEIVSFPNNIFGDVVKEAHAVQSVIGRHLVDSEVLEI
jgi:hypothetical protein